VLPQFIASKKTSFRPFEPPFFNIEAPTGRKIAGGAGLDVAGWKIEYWSVGRANGTIGQPRRACLLFEPRAARQRAKLD
jgi:hypothetical protein